MRNGVEISSGGAYNILIEETASTEEVRRSYTRRVEARQNAVYVSTLVVTGHLPGVYEYVVSNRAMTAPIHGNITIEG